MCDRRRADQQPVVARAARTLGARRKLTVVHALPHEPRGVRALRLLKRERYVPVQTSRRRSSAAISAPPSTGDRDAAVHALRGAARLIFVGGKGGVGKTTVAAALALRIAKAAAAPRVLLLSTDPAHSLGDVLRAPVSDRPARIAGGPPNLLVRELDAPAALAARREDLEGAIHDILTAFGAGPAGRGGVGELMDLAPPGIDELFGLISVAELFDDSYDTVIVDTAPTGHALRLLELPDAAREWVQVLLRVLLKYRDLVRPGQLAAELVKLSRQVRSLQALLRDASYSRFVVVTRAAALPQLETARLLQRLRTLHVSAPAVFVNALTLAPGTCPVCRAAAASERRALGRKPRRFGRRAIIQGPLMAPPPTGVQALDRWTASWIA
jgi:arsenite-transporting ATPase